MSTEYFSKEVFSKELRAYRLVERNQLAYNPSRINVGSIALQDIAEEVVVSPLYVVFSVDANRIDPAYLLRYLKSGPGLKQVEFQSIGTVRNNLKYDGLCRISILLPPLEVQRSRVRSLIALETIIKEGEEVLSKLDTLVKSRFAEMFGGVEYPLAMTSDIMGGFRNGVSPTKKGEVHSRVLTLSAVTQGKFDSSAWKDGVFKEVPPADKRVSERDFYICRGNGNKGLVGAAAFADKDYPDLVFPDTMIAGLIDGAKVNRVYLSYAWAQPVVRSQIESRARTTNGTFKINQEIVASVQFPLPPLTLQQEFADFAASVDKSRFAVRRIIENLGEYNEIAIEHATCVKGDLL